MTICNLRQQLQVGFSTRAGERGKCVPSFSKMKVPLFWDECDILCNKNNALISLLATRCHERVMKYPHHIFCALREVKILVLPNELDASLLQRYASLVYH